jgi:hypothetical protein
MKRLTHRGGGLMKDFASCKPKKSNLKYTRGTHVAGNFVIVYMVIGDNIISNNLSIDYIP